MRAKLPLRISSVILFFFALGHTVGFLQFRPESQPALDVMEAMRRVPFDFSGATVHWMDLFIGFGLALSVSGFVSTVMAWRISTVSIAERPLARIIAWLLCATEAGSFVISLRYFGTVQAVFAAACAATLAFGAIRLGLDKETEG